MSRPTANLRLFAAVYPPIEAARSMVELARGAAPETARLTPAEQVHLTVQFIGDTPSRLMQDVVESVERSCAGVRGFELRALRLIELPERGPRLLAMETDAPAELLEIHRRMVHRLARSARAKSAEEFLPHLTLARYAPGPGSGPGGARASDLPRVELPAFAAGTVRLMRSTLGAGGARHHEVAAFELSVGI